MFTDDYIVKRDLGDLPDRLPLSTEREIMTFGEIGLGIDSNIVKREIADPPPDMSWEEATKAILSRWIEEYPDNTGQQLMDAVEKCGIDKTDLHEFATFMNQQTFVTDAVDRNPLSN